MFYHTDMVDVVIQLTHTSTQCNKQQSFLLKICIFLKTKMGREQRREKEG